MNFSGYTLDMFIRFTCVRMFQIEAYATFVQVTMNLLIGYWTAIHVYTSLTLLS